MVVVFFFGWRFSQTNSTYVYFCVVQANCHYYDCMGRFKKKEKNWWKKISAITISYIVNTIQIAFALHVFKYRILLFWIRAKWKSAFVGIHSSMWFGVSSKYFICATIWTNHSFYFVIILLQHPFLSLPLKSNPLPFYPSAL